MVLGFGDFGFRLFVSYQQSVARRRDDCEAPSREEYLS